MTSDDEIQAHYANKYDPETMAKLEEHVQILHQNCYSNLDLETVRKAHMAIREYSADNQQIVKTQNFAISYTASDPWFDFQFGLFDDTTVQKWADIWDNQTH